MSHQYTNLGLSTLLATTGQYSLPVYPADCWSTQYLVKVINQSDVKFTAHIHRKLITVNQQLGMIKRALYWAPTNAKLLAYKTLCLPYLEYAAAAWNPSSREGLSDIEQLYNQAVRFIAGIKGRNGIDDAKARTYFATKKERPAIESFDAHSC